MTNFERFDVLTALFPFLDIPQRKPRPIQVLSTAAFNADHGHVAAAMITTGAGSRWPSDHAILNLSAAGLRHASLVRWKVFTLSALDIGRKIGHMSAEDHAVLDRAVATILGLRAADAMAARTAEPDRDSERQD